MSKVHCNRQYLHDLNELIDDLYADAFERYDWTWSELATKAGLAYATVVNLGNKTTRLPRLQTVWKLAAAVGRKVTLTAAPVKSRKGRAA